VFPDTRYVHLIDRNRWVLRRFMVFGLHVHVGMRDGNHGMAMVNAMVNAEARDRYVSPVAFAIIHAGLGDADAVFEWIEAAHRERRGWIAYLKIQPILDGLRPDPRFAAWLQRMRLE